jgi:hypothetical protein
MLHFVCYSLGGGRDGASTLLNKRLLVRRLMSEAETSNEATNGATHIEFSLGANEIDGGFGIFEGVGDASGICCPLDRRSPVQ